MSDDELDEILERFDVEHDYLEAKQAILDWHNKQVIQELREAKRSSDAGWYATYRIAELEKESVKGWVSHDSIKQ